MSASYGGEPMASTRAVLDAVRALNRQCSVVVVTSHKCYLNDESGRHSARLIRWGGHDPYSVSKAAQELVTQSYRLSFLTGCRGMGRSPPTSPG